MNKLKFSLAYVLMFIAALVFGFGCFLGKNFYTLGNSTQSILWAIIIAVSLSVTALGASLLKRTSRNFKTCFVWELILLVLFTSLTVFFTYSTFTHYFVVSRQKAEIRSKLNSTITQAENMFAEYEHYAANRENLYKRKLQSIVIAKNTSPSEYSNYGFENNGITDDKQIENKMFTVHADLFPTNYSDTLNNNGIKEVASTWLSNAKNKIAGWKPIGIVGIVNEVEQNSNDWLNKLIELSAVREKGEITKDFDYSLSFDNVKKHFTTLGNPTLLSIGISILLYLMILLAYLIAKRHTRFPGLKVIFGTGKSSINEL